jgi:hypothetical protein
MADFHEDELARAAAICEVLTRNGIPLVTTTIEGTAYTTDGDLQHNRHRYLIAALKDRAVDPSAQAAMYYLESTRKLALECPKSSLPCLLLYTFGRELSPYLDTFAVLCPQVRIVALAARRGFIDPTCKFFRPSYPSIFTPATSECKGPLHAISGPSEKPFDRWKIIMQVSF